MKKITLIITTSLFLAIISCGEKKEMEVQKADEEMVHSAHGLDVKVDNKFDPVCEMETEGHISDTIHYQQKVFGFCSSGCKEEFAKNPDLYMDKLN